MTDIQGNGIEYIRISVADNPLVETFTDNKIGYYTLDVSNSSMVLMITIEVYPTESVNVNISNNDNRKTYVNVRLFKKLLN